MIRFVAAGSLLALSLAASAQTVASSIVPNFSTAADEAGHIAGLAALGEARVGSRTVGGATYELDVQDQSKSTFNPAVDQSNGEKAWTNGGFESFSLSWASSSRTVTWTVGGVTTTRSLATAERFTDLWIRLFSQNSRRLTSSVRNVSVTKDFGAGTQTRPLSIAAHASPYSGFDGTALHVGGDVLGSRSDWTLSGDLAFGWQTASDASNSRAAIQFKLGTPVPEPASMAVVGIGLAAFRRRRSRR